MLSDPDSSESAMAFFIGRLGANVGQGGNFDYQHQGNRLTGYTQLRQFRHVANFNVGLFCQQAGLTLNEARSVGGSYGRVFSSNATPNEPHGLNPMNNEWLTNRFNSGQSGVFDKLPTQ
jgi:hypothetical protein